uniref:hypothetical protein n=1 Tax=Nocardia wallacei TaxID=480035 RepID=UPI002456BE3D
VFPSAFLGSAGGGGGGGAGPEATGGAGVSDETAAGVAGAALAGEQTGAEATRRGRRRVARTGAALSTDSQAAVFVLSSAEQEQPTVDFTDIPAAPVEPRSRPRRRSAGRAAGAPEQPN